MAMTDKDHCLPLASRLFHFKELMALMSTELWLSELIHGLSHHDDMHASSSACNILIQVDVIYQHWIQKLCHPNAEHPEMLGLPNCVCEAPVQPWLL